MLELKIVLVISDELEETSDQWRQSLIIVEAVKRLSGVAGYSKDYLWD